MISKVTAFTAALLCFVCYANAQTIEKGKNFINGSIAFNKQSNEPNAQNSNSSRYNGQGTHFSVKYGKFINDNSILGVMGIYSASKSDIKTIYNSTSSVTSNSTGNILGAGFFYRKYFEIANRFYFYGEANALYSNGKIKSTNITSTVTTKDTTKQNNFNIGVSPGLTYRVFKNLHLDASLPNVANVFYSSSKNNTMGKSESYGFQTSLSSQLLENMNIGLSLVF